jgi:DNA methylase
MINYFIPDRDLPEFYPLASFLQSPPKNVAAKYVEAFTKPGDVIIDPFACKPTIARTAQQMGRRAILFEHNPLWAWLARAMATLPSADKINATFTKLGDGVKDNVPLRTHIVQLYVTRCAECNQLTPADYFIHQRDQGLFLRHYRCNNCGVVRDDPATPDDFERANAFDSRGLHYHLAFQRVSPEDALHSDRIRKILDLYTPRNLYALVTITTKSDTLFQTNDEKQTLALLLLHLLDRGSSFYPAPDKAAQLTRHKQFVEFNLWYEMEKAAQGLAHDGFEFSLGDSPRGVVDSAGPLAWVGRSNAGKIASEIPTESAQLIIASPPPRRPTIWALSYFWGAWILKPASIQTLAQFLDPQTADITWQRHWYLDSIAASMKALARTLRRDARVIFIFDETSSEGMETVLLAGCGAGLELETLLFQPRMGEHPHSEYDSLPGSYRITFTTSHAALSGRVKNIDALNASELKSKIHAAALAAGREILTRRGEPLGFPWLHHAAYAEAARQGLLDEVMLPELKAPPGRFVFQAVQNGLAEGYAYDFDHYESEEQFLWFRRVKTDAPLINGVEQAVQGILSRGEIRTGDLEDEIYQKFPGDLTPEDGLVKLVAHAYADIREERWLFRREDFAVEKSQALESVAKLGARLGYAIQENEKPFDLAWKQGANIAHGFIWRRTAMFTDLARIHISPTRGYLIVPESQVALLTEKSKRLPQIADAFYDAGWGFLRIPFVQKLLDSETIEQSDIALMAGLVPLIALERAQLEMF